MAMPGSNLSFQRYLQQHMSLYLYVSILFIMGVIFGTLVVNGLSAQQQQSMALFLQSFLESVMHEPDGSSAQSLIMLYAAHGRWVLLILVLGLSVVGLPLILIIDFLKGVIIGFTIGYLVGQFSWKGLFLAVVSIVPHNLIVIPVILVSSVAAISFSLYLIRSLIMQRQAVRRQQLHRYLVAHMTLCGLLLIAALIQYAIVPHLLGWAAPIMLETAS
jgi:stage II sporulation protein M